MNRSLPRHRRQFIARVSIHSQRRHEKGLKAELWPGKRPTLAQSQIAALADSCNELGVPTDWRIRRHRPFT